MSSTGKKLDRRMLLTGGAAALGGAWLLGNRAAARPSTFRGLSSLAASSEEAPHTLLVLELSGGNDGLDTIVPYGDDLYHKGRTRIGLPTADLLRIDDYRAFNPDMRGLRQHFGEGRMAIIEGTGYAHPNRSHFTSQDIWYTAHESGRVSGDGWIGRLIAALYPDDVRVPHLIHVGTTKPYSVKSSTHPVVFLDAPSAYRFALNADGIVATSAGGVMTAKSMGGGADKKSPQPTSGPMSGSAIDRIGNVVHNARESSDALRRAALAYKPRVEYPDLQLARDLQTVAALLQGGVGARVLSVTHSGYDTHDSQRQRHQVLINELDGCLNAFFADVWGTPAGDKLVVLVFSEFGRRVEDNASGGTDHGVAGPMFVLGAPVKGGLYGKHPSLSDLDEGDLVHTTDFRSVYASVIDGWLGVDSAAVLGAKYPRLPLFA